MLFDLEDYTYARIIGTNSLPADQINWAEPYTTARATRDAYLKSVNEYVLAAGACSSAAEKKALESKYFEFLDALRVYGPASKQFWDAMISLPLKASGQFAAGDGFYVTEEGSWFSDVNYNWPSGTEHLISYPKFRNGGYWDNFRTYAFAATHGDSFLQSIVDQGQATLYAYTPLTQEVYDEYEAAMKALQLKAKEIMLMGEGRTSFEEYVTPEIPAWDGYPELSGYVRGTNSVAIAGATVRLVDADGEVFEKVTDEKGYYKFDKELFYTSIALGTASTVDIFLKPTVGSASLYDTTSLLQNSFFGAENDRSLTWPVSIKMGKPARRNIKIEFLPDYSAYPSLSGTVLDQDGNPVANALVELFLTPTSFTHNEAEVASNSDYSSIGSKYNQQTGSWTKSSKYNLFGEEKSLLTDENGHYEYPSQMIGEWIHSEYYRYINNVDPSSMSTLSSILLNDPTTKSTGYYSNSSIFGKGFLGTYWQEGQWQTAWSEFTCDPVVQPDGKLIVAGGFGSYGNVDLWENAGLYEPNKTSIIRLNTDGSIDSTFNTNITNCFSNTNENYFNAIALQSDGKILLYGNIGTVDGTEIGSGRTMVRLNQDGSLDTVFDFSSYSDQEIVEKIIIANDGKIITLASNWWNYGHGRMSVFNPDGTFDNTFVLPFDATDLLIRTILIESDGSMLIAGRWSQLFDADGNSYDYPAVVKLNPDLTIDTSFRCAFDINSNDIPEVRTIVKDDNGTYLIGGSFNAFMSNDESIESHHIARINSDGSLNNRFQGASCVWGGQMMPYGVSSPISKLGIVDSPAGKRIIALYAGNTFLLDHSTGLPVQEFSGFDNEVKGFSVSGSEVYVVGAFQYYYSQADQDGTTGEFRTVSPHIAKLEYGDFEFFKNIENPWVGRYNIAYFEDGSQKNLQRWTINTVQCYLNPWIQSADGTVYDFNSKESGIAQPSKIYDYSDWFNSRFNYAANDRYGERYLITMNGGEGKDKTLNIHEILTDAEYGAEKVYFTAYEGQVSVSTVRTTSGYARVVFPDGTKQIFGSGSPDYDFSISFNQELPVADGTYQGQDYYFYSCDGEHGAASGKIKRIGFYDRTYDLDVTRLTELEYLSIAESRIKYLDLRQSQSLKELYINPVQLMRIDGLENLPNLEGYGIDGPIYTDVVESTEGHQYSVEADELYAHRMWWTPGAMEYLSGENVNGATKLASGKYMIYGRLGAYEKRDVIARQYYSFESNGLMRLNSDGSIDTTFTVGSGFGGSETTGVVETSNGKLIVGGNIVSFKDQEIIWSKGKLVRITQAGNLDNSFPRVVSGSSDYVKPHALPNGNILLTGRFILESTGNWCGAAVINENGALIATLPLMDSSSVYVSTAKIFPDGKILLKEEYGPSLYKYNSDYTIDESFAFPFNGYSAIGQEIALDSSGCFYLTHSTFDFEGTHYKPGVLKFNADGTIDTAFAAKMELISLQNWNGQEIYDRPGFVGVLSNGNIVINGYFNKVNGTYQSGTLVLNPDGSLITANGRSISGSMIQTPTWGNYSCVISQIVEIGDDLLILGGNNLDQFIGQNMNYEYWSGPLTKVYKHPFRTYRIKDIRSTHITGGYDNSSWFRGEIDYSGLPNLTQLNAYLPVGSTGFDLYGLTKIESLTIYSDMTIDFDIDLSSLSLLRSIEFHADISASASVTFAESLANLSQFSGSGRVFSSLPTNGCPALQNIYLYRQYSGDLIAPASTSNFHIYSNGGNNASPSSIDLSATTNEVYLNMQECSGTEVITGENTIFSSIVLSRSRNITIPSILNISQGVNFESKWSWSEGQWLPVFANENMDMTINCSNPYRNGQIFMYCANLTGLTINGKFDRIWLRFMDSLESLSIHSEANAINLEGLNNLKSIDLSGSNCYDYFSNAWGYRQANENQGVRASVTGTFSSIDLSSFTNIRNIYYSGYGNYPAMPILPVTSTIRYVGIQFYESSADRVYDFSNVVSKLVQGGSTSAQLGGSARNLYLSSTGYNDRATLLNRSWSVYLYSNGSRI